MNNCKEINLLETKEVCRNRWMRVREDIIIRKDGSKGIYGVVEKKDFAIIIAVDGEYTYLVEQYRYPVEKRFWEFPQGSWEESDITPEELAKAELKEETGLISQNIKFVGHLFGAYGYSNQGYNIFIATDFEYSNCELDPEEVGLISKKFKITEVENMIINSQIKDSTSIAAFGLLKLKNLI